MSVTTLNYGSMQWSGRDGTGWGRKENDMKNKVFEVMRSLQLFAEGEGTGSGDSGNGDGAGGNSGPASEGGEGNAPVSFDDFLKQEGNQAEFDRRVQKAIQTAVGNAQKKWQTLTDNKVSEAEKLSQMTAEEKEKYRADKAEKELDNLKKQIALGDMAKTARKMLTDEEINVPDEIIMNLVSDDAEKTKESVEAFAKVFKEAVQSAVKEALKGAPPKTGTGGSGSITKEQINAIKDPTERQRMIAENIQLYQ